MQTLVFLAEITFLIQGILFPIFFAVCCRFIYIGLTTPASKEKATSSDKTTPIASKIDVSNEILKPLNCTSCGGVLEMDSHTKNCNHCGATATIPPNYKQIFILREDATAKLNKAGKNWRKANLLTSSFVRFLMLAMVIWVFSVFPILVVGSAEGMTSFSDNLIAATGEWGAFFYAISWFALLFWVVILFFSYGLFQPKVRKNLPVLESDFSVISKEEIADCSQCGAHLHFKAKDIGCFCNYCGTETYRVKFSSALFNRANDIRKKASFSLIQSMEAYSEAVDDLIEKRKVEIKALVVSEKDRNSGIGHELVKSSVEWARLFGLHTIYLNCNILRNRAHCFYEKEGFKKVKTSNFFEMNI